MKNKKLSKKYLKVFYRLRMYRWEDLSEERRKREKKERGILGTSLAFSSLINRLDNHNHL